MFVFPSTLSTDEKTEIRQSLTNITAKSGMSKRFSLDTIAGYSLSNFGCFKEAIFRMLIKP